TQCQNALNESMVRVCGDTENCDALVLDDGVGTRAFKYEVCRYSGDVEKPKLTDVCYDSLDAISTQELANVEDGGWAARLSGLVYWGSIEYIPDDDRFTNEQEYLTKVGVDDSFERGVIKDRVFGLEISGMSNMLNSAMNAIEADPIVQYCMTGRQVQGMRKSNGDGIDFGNKKNQRFPQLTKQIKNMIAASVLQKARENYNKKYDEEMTRMMQDQVKAAARVDQKTKETVAENTCAAWQDSSSLPESETPKKSQVGKWIAVGLITAAAVVVTVLTWGAGATVAVPLASGEIASITVGTGAVAATAATVGAGAAAAVAASGGPVGKDVNNWNYKENITTMFNKSTGECTRTRVIQNCAKIKKNYCKEWEDPKTVVDKVNLY
ncbi:MAG: hypothetical protein ACLRFI_04145, partial [Alphaproteobacteria bacterium]